MSRLRGFSLVEVLIAATLLGVAAVALFLTFHSGVLEAKVGEDRLKALAIAQKEIENAKQLAGMGRRSLEQAWPDAASRTRAFVVDGLYDVRVDVNTSKAVTVGGSSAEVGEVVVTVTWHRPDRGELKLELASIIDQAYY